MVRFHPYDSPERVYIKPCPQGKGEKVKTMKKATAKKSTKTAKSEATYPVLPLKDKPVSVKLDKGGTRYILGEGVSLDIYEGDTYDYGSLNVYGLVVSVTFPMISKGERAGEVFVSYPQYKAKDGTYKPYVKNFSKPLNDAIKKALKVHYSEGFMEVQEGEELPFE